MLNVSEGALKVIDETLRANNVEEGRALRLAQGPGGQFGLQVDAPAEDDQVVTAGDKPVLVVDRRIADHLDGALLDAVDSGEGVRLTLRLPGDESSNGHQAG